MNRRGFMAMIGAAICLPATGEKKLAGATMRELMRRSPVIAKIVQARVIQLLSWTEVAVIKPENQVNPYIKEYGRIRRTWESES